MTEYGGKIHDPNRGCVIRSWDLDTIAKNDNGRWVLVPQRLGDLLLSPESPLDILTFKGCGRNKDMITYDKAKDSGIWQLNGEDEVNETVADIVEVCDSEIMEQLTRHVTAEVLFWVQCRTYTNREDFTSPSGKIPLLNGVYDMTTGILEPHRQENHFLYQVSIKHDPARSCPRIDAFLGEVLGERKMLGYEMAGYMLCANAESQPNKWQRAFMLIGAGDNGKSTYLNLVTALLGDRNVSNQTLQMLVDNRFSAAALDHKLANIAADIGDKSLYNAAQFKALTGGDKITAENKFKDPYEFRNRAILAFSCNILPESYDDSNAYHKRWVIIPFENIFTGDKKDPKILDRLTTPEELAGFYNKAIAAYREMNSRGTFTSEGATVESKRAYYQKLSDSISSFMEDCVLYEPEAIINKQHLYKEFLAYAQKHGYWKHYDDTKFFKKVREKGGDRISDTRVKDAEGIPHRVFRGIKLETEPTVPAVPTVPTLSNFILTPTIPLSKLGRPDLPDTPDTPDTTIPKVGTDETG
jgi:putative DNA primase/helicase